LRALKATGQFKVKPVRDEDGRILRFELCNQEVNTMPNECNNFFTEEKITQYRLTAEGHKKLCILQKEAREVDNIIDSIFNMGLKDRNIEKLKDLIARLKCCVSGFGV
jgi:molybdenum cofactor biosynthesis enzyme MoaA